MRYHVHLALLLACTCLLPASVHAQQGRGGDRPPPPAHGNRPTDKIAADLGVSEQQFIDCFSGVQPAQRGSHPSGDRQRMNKAVLLPCLQRANPAITNDSLDAVMDTYRPEGPMRR